MTCNNCETACTVLCVDCGKKIKAKLGSLGTGCAIRHAENELGRPAGNVCYNCCGRDDEAVMRKMGHSKSLPLYLTDTKEGIWQVGNWPGTLKFRVKRIHHNGGHNIAGKRTDIWFLDSDNNLWWGVNYGSSGIVHCKRIKNRYLPQSLGLGRNGKLMMG